MISSAFSLSVIIPLYNKEKYIEICIQSILQQTLLPTEIIIVNDCSTDKSIEIAERTIQNSNSLVHFKIIHNDKNSGPGITRNNGIEQSSSDYIMFLDADDQLMPDYVANVKECITLYNPGMIVCRVLQSKTKRILPSDAIFQFSETTSNPYLKITKPMELLAIEFPFVGGNYIYHRKRIPTIKFNHERMFEDWLFCYNILQETIRLNLNLYLINKPSYLYLEDDLTSVSKQLVSTLDQITIPSLYYKLETEGKNSIRKKLFSIWMFNSSKRLNDFSLKLSFFKKYYSLIIKNFTLNKYYIGSFINIIFNRAAIEKIIYLLKRNG